MTSRCARLEQRALLERVAQSDSRSFAEKVFSRPVAEVDGRSVADVTSLTASQLASRSRRTLGTTLGTTKDIPRDAWWGSQQGGDRRR